jgi:hypothetical protein
MKQYQIGRLVILVWDKRWDDMCWYRCILWKREINPTDLGLIVLFGVQKVQAKDRGASATIDLHVIMVNGVNRFGISCDGTRGIRLIGANGSHEFSVWMVLLLRWPRQTMFLLMRLWFAWSKGRCWVEWSSNGRVHEDTLVGFHVQSLAAGSFSNAFFFIGRRLPGIPVM